ncbi:MAG: lytic transglycosylase domain-containing protein [Acidithiobacillus sp.]|nr:lytic transglycosylase domain-containing protein [Acidithiobacillus sp.]
MKRNLINEKWETKFCEARIFMGSNSKVKPVFGRAYLSLSLFASMTLFSTQCAWSDSSGIVALSGTGDISNTTVSLHQSSLLNTTPVINSPTFSSIRHRIESGGKPHESRLIASTMRVMSTMYGVPKGLLRAISLTESGISGKPWPWTLNVYGQAYRYTNEQQTVAAVKRFLARGITLVDIGPMQVDWQYHGWRFGSVRAAANPLRNVAVAARILRDAYAQTGSWVSAVGQYHGGNTARQQQYIHQVMTKWRAPAWKWQNTLGLSRGINLIPVKNDTIIALTNTARNY